MAQDSKITNGIDAADVFDDTAADSNDDAANDTAAETSNGDSPEARLADLQAQLDQEHQAHLRARADFANFKRRNDEEKDRIRSIVGEDILTGLLPIVDNFERALSAAEATQDFEKLIGGVQATLRQMQDFLARQGVQPIVADPGDAFDPNIHNAVLRDETTEYPENAVVAELQKGYTLGGRVLRPAMVRVATGVE
jgi:molecular chaperone GrpE